MGYTSEVTLYLSPKAAKREHTYNYDDEEDRFEVVSSIAFCGVGIESLFKEDGNG